MAVTIKVVLTCTGYSDGDDLSCGNIQLPCLDFTSEDCKVAASLLVTPQPACIAYTIEIAPPVVDLLDNYQIIIHTMGDHFVSSPYGDLTAPRTNIVTTDALNGVDTIVNYSNSDTLDLPLLNGLFPGLVQTPLVNQDGDIVAEVGEIFGGFSLAGNVATLKNEDSLCGSQAIRYVPVNESRSTYFGKAVSGEYCYRLNLDCGIVVPIIVRVGLD